MNSYIARQPIFNKELEVVAYELLYRDENNSTRAMIIDGSKATSSLLSDAANVFGLQNLTDHKPAFINFTDDLINTDFAKLFDPKDIVIELLEDVTINSSLISKISELKEMGYKIALDDYDGNFRFRELMPYIDILKVDFMLNNRVDQIRYSSMSSMYPQMHILAEKVETKEDYQIACDCGYEFYQGYYFQKPQLMQRKVPQVPMATFNQLMCELNVKETVNFEKCAVIIKQDALLTFRLLQKMKTLQYYRGNTITDIHSALVVMGQKEVRRWLYLMLIRENSMSHSAELIRLSLTRALFAQKIAHNSLPDVDEEEAFLVGMFSLLDLITGRSFEELLNEIEVPEVVRDVLLYGKSNTCSKLLRCVCNYEDPDWNDSFETNAIPLTESAAWHFYMEAMMQADKAFKE